MTEDVHAVMQELHALSELTAGRAEIVDSLIRALGGVQRIDGDVRRRLSALEQQVRSLKGSAASPTVLRGGG